MAKTTKPQPGSPQPKGATAAGPKPPDPGSKRPKAPKPASAAPPPRRRGSKAAAPEDPKAKSGRAGARRSRTVEAKPEPPKSVFHMPPKHKAKNLVERLRRDEDEVLRFMTDSDVPFKGNGVEFDLRLPTVKRQLSGNFKSIENADEFCLVRSYLLTCARNGVPPLRALMTLFQGALPDFIPVDRDEGGGAAPEAAAG